MLPGSLRIAQRSTARAATQSPLAQSRKRIARGSGTSVQEVNQLLRQYAQMRKMFKSAAKGGGMQRRMMGALGGMRGMGR